MKDIFSLKDKVAVVTGGLGQLGQEFCVSLADYGANVAVLDLLTSPKKSLKKFSLYCKGKQIMVFKTDITRKNEIKKSLAGITKLWREPEILINNAAIDSPPNASVNENGPFESYPESSLERIINVNLKGVFFCCQIIGGAMAKKGKGSIINISSIYGVVSPNQDIYAYKRRKGHLWYKPAVYSITKSAVIMLTKYLATYWARKDVRVNSLTPSGIYNYQDTEFLKEYQKRIPIGRMARPDELNGAIIFLASDASSYMTGANLIIDGGWTAW